MAPFPKPSVTVDVVAFSIFDDDLKVLLIRRGRPPYEGRWALPGGFIEIDEPLKSAARRELEEETGLRITHLEQLHTFGEPGRDPRGRTISVVYLTLVKADQVAPKAASDAADVGWFSAFGPPPLAFDHDQILRCAVHRLRGNLELTTVGGEWLPRRFRLAELQRIYEIILQRKVDSRDFRKKVLAQGQLLEVGQASGGSTHRATNLYSFRRARSKQTSPCNQ